MRVIGIDPGSKVTGWSLFVDGELAAYDNWKFKGNSDTPDGLCRKLSEGYSKMTELIDREKPELVVFESQFIGNKTKETNSILKLCYFVGGMLMAVIHKDVKADFVTPLEIKTAITGNYRAGKKEVRDMINYSFDLNLRPKDNDISDAIAIGWMFSDGLEEAA